VYFLIENGNAPDSCPEEGRREVPDFSTGGWFNEGKALKFEGSTSFK